MVFYDPTMFYEPSAESTYTRAQLCALAGIPEGVASFWIRNGILRPVAGGEGKGSHRLFDRIEVSNAAILSAMQSYGINVGMLSSLSSMMHQARDICDGAGIPLNEIEAAARLRKVLDRFRRGEMVEVIRVIDDPTARSGSRGQHFPAESEAEIIEHTFIGEKFSDLSAVVQASEQLPDLETDFLHFYMDVHNEIVSDSSDPSWLLWPKNEGWGYVNSPEGISAFPDLPVASVTSAMYLAVGAIVRNVWGNSLGAKRVQYWSRRLAEEIGGRHERIIRERLASAIEERDA